MSEVLSQNEIDNLLKALSSGELDVDEMKNSDEKQIKNYDFARPSKFAKEHLRTLEIIFENFGRLLATNLPAYLRKSVTVDVVNSEVVIYSEFSNALSNPVLLGVVGMNPLNGSVIMEMASNLGFAIVDRLLGGQGNALEKEREFSEIELTIIDRILSICVNLMEEPWENVVKVQPRLERIETNSQFAQIISPTETIAIVTMNLKIGEVEGLMNVCLPYTTLEPVMDKLNTKYWFANMQEKGGETFEKEIEGMIRRSEIPIKAVLGKSKISVADFVTLQYGDIIRLNKKVDQELDVYVGNIKKFKALPGYFEDKYAVRVTEVYREEEG
ncbi:flagellar motor switch protein FliM [Lachnospira multipara]|uniref:flagellar motor switch protein FliM n=1 Tax=Lachnospira multipara TaxID=28051 RepID=UPI000487F897|nr:flagellar motor switch protein FliM [Lachnospira multipara]